MAQKDKKQRDKKDVTLRIRVPSNMKDDLEAWCFKNDHSMSCIVRLMIRAHLAEPSRVFLEGKEEVK